MERYEAYKDSGVEWIGEIPAEWKILRIQQCFAEERRINDGLESFHALKFSAGSIVPKPEKWDEEEVADTYARYRCVSPGTIMINSLNLNFDLKSLRVGLVEEEGIITSAYVAIVPGAEIEPRFANYTLKSWDYRKAFHNMGRGLRLTLDWHEFSKYRIQTPSLFEQQAIADYLDAKTAEIDALVADCEREVELLQEYRKAVISEAVTKGLDPDVPMKDSGIEWIGEIPVDWEVARLDKVAVRKSGHTPDKKVPEYWDGNIVWISLADSYRLRANVYVNESTTMTTEAGIANSSAELLPEGTVLLSRDASVGLTAIAGVQLAVSQHFMAYICDSNLSNEFLRYVFLAMHQEFEKLSMGSTIPTIGLPLMRKLTIPYPSRKAQDDIVGYLNSKVAEIDMLITDNQSMAEKLCEYRRSLISEAVTGKFKVPGV